LQKKKNNIVDKKKAQYIRNQYHPAFCGAMELEFREDKNHLTYHKEYNLNTKPNMIDFIVINNDDKLKVHSKLGAIFKKYNIIEYKSPGDSLDVAVYNRTMGYMYLYKAYGNINNTLDDMTITFIRKRYPRILIKWLKDQNFNINQYENGIYHVTKQGHIDMQIIATRLLDDKYTWIKRLTSGLKLEDILYLEENIKYLDDDQEKINAESVMDIIYKLNSKMLKEVGYMGAFRDYINEKAEEHIKDLSEQLQNKDEQLKIEQDKNKELREENRHLKEMLNKIAML